MNDTVTLEIDGTTFSGWTSVAIRRSLDTLCGTFEVSFVDSWSTTARVWAIQPNHKVEIRVEDDLVMTGWIDRVSTSMTGTSRSFAASGRDVTGDLVDCSPTAGARRTWRAITAFELAKAVCEPFGIDVRLDASSAGPKTPDTQERPSETVFSLIERTCRDAGLLVITDPQGRVVLLEPGRNRADVAITQQANVIGADFTADFTNRFSNYYAFGQSKSTPEQFADQATRLKAEAQDVGVTRYRPRTILAPENTTFEKLGKRVQWEAATAAARGTRVRLELNGWRQGPLKLDRLWTVNEIVLVDMPKLGWVGDLLVESVELVQSETTGQTTTLELTRRDAWIPEPVINTKNDPTFIIGEVVKPR